MSDRPTPSRRATVVVVGLGPAGPELTTAEANAVLAAAGTVYLRTARHPAAEPWIARGARSFDHRYETGTNFEQTYGAIVADLVALAEATGRVVYAVPGSPNVLESTVVALRSDDRVVVETVAGLSFLDLVWDRLGVDPVNDAVRLINGERFAVDAAGERGPLLVSHTWSGEILSAIKLSVEPRPGAKAIVLSHLGLADEAVIETEWADLDRVTAPDHLTCVYLPDLSDPPAGELARAAEIVDVLRRSCPWDAAQSHRSLVRHLLEETYEAIEAIDELGDPPDLAASEHLEEELGDVLCQVLFHSTIAREEGLFSLADVARTLGEKLVRRHPHVFAPSATGPGGADAETVLSRWEQQKQQEKGRASLTDGIPVALPALAYAAKLERTAKSAGLGIAMPADELGRTLADLGERVARGDEMAAGEALSLLARAAASVGIDPEEVLRHTTIALRQRFVRAEQLARDSGAVLAEASAVDRLGFWRSAGST